MALTKVTNTGIADNAVTTDKIEDGTIIATDITPGTITNAKLANSSITVNGSSLTLGGSATIKHIDWQAVTVADGSTTLSAEAGKGYFLDTNAGVIEVFLPSSPTRGDTVVLVDYSGTFAINQIIINTGGQLLDSTAGNDFKVTTNNSIVELVYVDSAKGWLVKLNQAAGTTPSTALDGGNLYDTDANYIEATGGTITSDGDYRIHTFIGDDCFAISALGSGIPCSEASTVDYLVVAGGGGGGHNPNNRGAGGGGAGGFREGRDSTLNSPHTSSPIAATTGITVTATTYPISVGAGGSGVAGNTRAPSGSNSVFSTITSTGGGGGGSESCQPGASGGSGGGGARGNVATGTGGSGNTPPTSPSQGNPGGAGSGPTNSWGTGAGGGGAGGGAAGGSAACNVNNSTIGAAGIGTGTAINPGTGTPGPCGSLRYYSGGGAGTAGDSTFANSPVAAKTGAYGGGGDGKQSAPAPGGTANTGGGGGAARTTPVGSGAGGSGIVIIRYRYT